MGSVNVLFLLFLCYNIFVVLSNDCIDQNGNTVDWFVAYKLPKNKNSDKNAIRDGLGYVYMTSQNFFNWTFADHPIDSPKSLIYKTLEPLYSGNKNLLYILYNDQPPSGEKKSKGHTKGIVMLNTTTGFWLIHSVPHFPAFGDSFKFPETGTHYGQSFLCLSLNLENLDRVGLQLQYNEPQIYGVNLPTNMVGTTIQNLIHAAQNYTIKTAPFYNKEKITTVKGTQIISFAKSKLFAKELYTDLVAPILQTDLDAETWPNERDRLPSNCSHKFKVNNIKSISMDNINYTFTTTEDHSKWAVSPLGGLQNWICIGDINRSQHQLYRGGGTACMSNNVLAENYQKLIATIEECELQ